MHSNNSPQQSNQPLKETQRKRDQKHIKLRPFSYWTMKPIKDSSFSHSPCTTWQPTARTYTTKQAGRHGSKKHKITLSLPLNINHHIRIEEKRKMQSNSKNEIEMLNILKSQSFAFFCVLFWKHSRFLSGVLSYMSRHP